MSLVHGKTINFFGRPCTLVCDGLCNLAWGINNRLRRQLSEDEDDYVFLSGTELREQGQVAPDDPGTYEGGEGKPQDMGSRFNKWCARECERSHIFAGVPPNMDKPEPNTPREEKGKDG